MNGENIGTCIGKLLRETGGLDDHHVHIDWQLRDGPNRLQHGYADGDIRYKTAVHHIEVKFVSPGSFDGPYRLAKVRKICCQ